MPALQVREFPEDLYDELRVYAAAHHRSMAQQTVAAVEEVIRGKRRETARVVPFESVSERKARLAKRQEVLDRAALRRAHREAPIPSPLEMLSQARDERDGEFDVIVQDIMGASQ